MSAVPTVPQVFFSVHALCTWGSVNSVDRNIGTKPKKKKNNTVMFVTFSRYLSKEIKSVVSRLKATRKKSYNWYRKTNITVLVMCNWFHFSWHLCLILKGSICGLGQDISSPFREVD